MIKEGEVGKEEGNAGWPSASYPFMGTFRGSLVGASKTTGGQKAENWDPVIPGEGARRSEIMYVQMHQCICKYIQTEHLCFVLNYFQTLV